MRNINFYARYISACVYQQNIDDRRWIMYFINTFMFKSHRKIMNKYGNINKVSTANYLVIKYLLLRSVFGLQIIFHSYIQCATQRFGKFDYE